MAITEMVFGFAMAYLNKPFILLRKSFRHIRTGDKTRVSYIRFFSGILGGLSGLGLCFVPTIYNTLLPLFTAQVTSDGILAMIGVYGSMTIIGLAIATVASKQIMRNFYYNGNSRYHGLQDNQIQGLEQHYGLRPLDSELIFNAFKRQIFAFKETIKTETLYTEKTKAKLVTTKNNFLSFCNAGLVKTYSPWKFRNFFSEIFSEYIEDLQKTIDKLNKDIHEPKRNNGAERKIEVEPPMKLDSPISISPNSAPKVTPDNLPTNKSPFTSKSEAAAERSAGHPPSVSPSVAPAPSARKTLPHAKQSTLSSDPLVGVLIHDGPVTPARPKPSSLGPPSLIRSNNSSPPARRNISPLTSIEEAIPAAARTTAQSLRSPLLNSQLPAASSGPPPGPTYVPPTLPPSTPSRETVIPIALFNANRPPPITSQEPVVAAAPLRFFTPVRREISIELEVKKKNPAPPSPKEQAIPNQRRITLTLSGTMLFGGRDTILESDSQTALKEFKAALKEARQCYDAVTPRRSRRAAAR